MPMPAETTFALASRARRSATTSATDGVVHDERPTTKRLYRQIESRTRARRFIIKRFIPFKFPQQIKQALLLTACDEFLQGTGDGCFLCAFTAQFESALDQFRIERQISCHVSLFTHDSTQLNWAALRELVAGAFGNER